MVRKLAFLISAGAACSAAATIDQTDVGAIPSQADASTAPTSTQSTFALNTLFLGDAFPDGGEAPLFSNGAWIGFGYDIDDHVTDRDTPDVCTLASGAWLSTQIDGNDGIDNSFGANLLALIQYGTGSPNMTADATSEIQSGAWTLQLQVTGLSDDPNQSAVGLLAQAFVGTALSTPPSFDDSTNWPAASGSLLDGTTIAGGASVQFKTVYVNSGVVVLRDATQPLVLPIAMLNYFYTPPKPSVPFILLLTIHNPIITFVHSDPTSGTRGIIAGTLDTHEAATTADVLAQALESTHFCAGYDFVVEQAQDILADSSNAPNVACDAISIGFGFTAKRIANPSQVVTASLAQVDPCAASDAGIDGSIDGGSDAQ